MEDKELKCKLEQMAAGMGYEVKKKFKEEMDLIHKTFRTMIIFGFLTVFIIIGTYLSINIMYMSHNKVTEKIAYIDRIVKEPCRKNLDYLYTKRKKDRDYHYYNNTSGKVWKFYTEAHLRR